MSPLIQHLLSVFGGGGALIGAFYLGVWAGRRPRPEQPAGGHVRSVERYEEEHQRVLAEVERHVNWLHFWHGHDTQLSRRLGAIYHKIKQEGKP